MFVEELQHIQVVTSKVLWLSATEGDNNLKLSRLSNWPKGIEAEEGVWRDHYSGEQLDNYTLPWEGSDKGNTSLQWSLIFS